ncbi:glyoxalase [Microlunatus endophyticus]|uniref:Glyoxalase n=1 Tax=Microlunatus endophyticus TaxID=1716077 RepID=A0A917S4P6_9ACTN|nr:VOC family protein [Microlunatus endophyticus]GGL57633.1 glyoxalase [Microlunatus endophyticus]
MSHPLSNSSSITAFAVTVDAADARRVATFWGAALGRPVAAGADEDSASVEEDPQLPGPRLGFRKVPEPKAVKNRLHFDLVTQEFDPEVQRLVGLGATKLRESNGGLRYATLADPEGNEFDLVAV